MSADRKKALLTTNQLESLRKIAVSLLEAAPSSRVDLGLAPEDLVIACDRALGWDEMAEEDQNDKRALVETSHRQCVAAWRSRHAS